MTNRPTEHIVVQIKPVLLDTIRMAAAMCLSRSTLDNLRTMGCPCLQIPGTKKILYDPAVVVVWIEAQQEKKYPGDITDAYCKARLAEHSTLVISDIPQRLIEPMRQYIKAHRAHNKRQEECDYHGKKEERSRRSGRV